MKKSIGIDVKAPEKACEDPNCPWHGKIAVRGRVFKGTVKSSKGTKTAVVQWAYHRYLTKYERYERRKSKTIAHNPPCIRAKDGDNVVIAECRPISKTKGFIIVSKEGGASK
ncbi:MAG: 30S ribosomal protein S17 [Candidatus Aenigmarchaeota archaeon]